MSPIEQGGILPEDQARISKSILSREQSPSTRQQSAEYANWRALADAPADPFNLERIPISRLRQMRRDPMISFALHFIKTPLIRAPWYIRCEDAQIAAFVDYSLRRIYARLVMQYMLALDFGFAAIAKKFVQEPVLETYFDPNEVKKPETPDSFLLPGGVAAPKAPSELDGKEKPVWSEGSVLPVIWKPFVPLAPEDVEVIFNNAGEFDGIKYTPRFQVQTTAGGKGGSNEGEIEIDVYHSLWITNERDSVFGNVFGYPRIGYATNYWWSYWHRHGLADRSFEKDSDPPTVVRHPEGKFEDPDTGDILTFRDLALDVGDRVRSGSTIALPSEVFTNFEDRPSSIYKWDIDFLKGGGNFEAFSTAFDYLDVMKLRAVWVPEQALIEGKGGQSSRNVADTFGSAFQESQAVLLSEFDQHINQFVIPQLVALNFPEFEGKAEKITRGFSNKDVETMRQLIQLIGQKDISQLPVDKRQMMEDLGVPLIDIKDEAANAEQAAAEAIPPVVPAIPGQQAGTVPTPGVNGQQANPSSAFSYVQPPDRISVPTLGISLADDFLSSLPESDHYQDKLIRQMASQLWLVFHDLYKGQYNDFAEWLETDGINLADEDRKSRLASMWPGNTALWASAIEKARTIYRNVATRAARLALRKSDLDTNFNVEDVEVNEWINQQLQRTMTSIQSTIKDDVSRKAVQILEDSESVDPVEVADRLRQEMTDYPTWQATRAARTEIRDLWNGATLFAGQAAGIRQVQAVDARLGKTDEDCEERDGEIFSIEDAFNVDEHPNGTLAWRLLASDKLTIEKTDNEQVLAKYDPESETIYLSDTLTKTQRRNYLLEVAAQAGRNGN